MKLSISFFSRHTNLSFLIPSHVVGTVIFSNHFLHHFYKSLPSCKLLKGICINFLSPHYSNTNSVSDDEQKTATRWKFNNTQCIQLLQLKHNLNLIYVLHSFQILIYTTFLFWRKMKVFCKNMNKTF